MLLEAIQIMETNKPSTNPSLHYLQQNRVVAPGIQGDTTPTVGRIAIFEYVWNTVIKYIKREKQMYI